MIIELRSDAPPHLADVDRLDRLHAACRETLSEAVFDELCQPGPDDAHVWVSIAALRAGVLASDPSSADTFDAVIAYATSKGWVDESGTRVRAHLEVPGV